MASRFSGHDAPKGQVVYPPDPLTPGERKVQMVIAATNAKIRELAPLIDQAGPRKRYTVKALIEIRQHDDEVFVDVEASVKYQDRLPPPTPNGLV